MSKLEQVGKIRERLIKHDEVFEANWLSRNRP